MPLELVSGIPPGVPATPRNAVVYDTLEASRHCRGKDA